MQMQPRQRMQQKMQMFQSGIEMHRVTQMQWRLRETECVALFLMVLTMSVLVWFFPFLCVMVICLVMFLLC